MNPRSEDRVSIKRGVGVSRTNGLRDCESKEQIVVLFCVRKSYSVAVRANIPPLILRSRIHILLEYVVHCRLC